MRIRKNLSINTQGFTIVELLVYAGILVVFIYMLTNMFTAVIDMQLESESTSAVVQDSRYILSRLNYDIKRASSIVLPGALGEESSTLIIQIGSTNYTYSISGGAIQLAGENGIGVLNSDRTQISGLSFRRYGNINGKHSVRVAFTVTSTTQRIGSGSESQSFQTTIGLQ